MIIAVHQPNYIPWLGYFNKILKADIFVFLDNVQFSKNSYINRVQIAGHNEPMWLSQPVAMKGKFGDLISEVTFADDRWKEKHRKTIEQYYRKHPYYDVVRALLDKYGADGSSNLSEFNIGLNRAVCSALKLEKKTVVSSELGLPEYDDPTERLVRIVRHLGGKTYLSGKGGAKYHEEKLFEENGIRIEYTNSAIKPYTQFKREQFIGGLSVIDAICNVGVEGVRELLSGS